VIAGFELSNHYAELVDPIKQRELLEAQAKAKADGDAEAMDMNTEFLIAMEHGMPPMTGTGVGIDRLVSIFTEQGNLRDTVFFPLMKPVEKKLSKSQMKKLEEKRKKEEKAKREEEERLRLEEVAEYDVEVIAKVEKIPEDLSPKVEVDLG